MNINDFQDVKYLRRAVIFLYDLLDDISTAGDAAKSNDQAYRKMVEKIQAKKNDCGVQSLNGYTLDIKPFKFQLKCERNKTPQPPLKVVRFRQYKTPKATRYAVDVLDDNIAALFYHCSNGEFDFYANEFKAVRTILENHGITVKITQFATQ